MIIHYLWDGCPNGQRKLIVKCFKNKSKDHLHKKTILHRQEYRIVLL
jgi:hypothetical protein